MWVSGRAAEININAVTDEGPVQQDLPLLS